MPRLVRLFGESPSLYYLGARLRQSGLDVELYREQNSQSLVRSLRPVRLQSKTMELIKDLMRSQTRPYFFIEQAPCLSSWSQVGSLAHEGFFDQVAHVDRWVDRTELLNQLRDVFEVLGGRVHSEPLQRLPKGKGTSLLEVMDIDPTSIETTLRSSYFPQMERRPVLHSVEMWMPFAKEIDGEARFEFTKFENTLSVNEVHPQGGRVLSLYTSSQYSLQRALKALKDPRGIAPTSWKARMLSEGGTIQETHHTHSWGHTGFYRPGIWAIGKSVGLLNPLHNLDVSDSVCQAERLFKNYMERPRGESLLLAADDWRRSEKQRCLKDLSRSQFTERLIFGSRWSELAQRTSQLLPPRIRQSLKSPI